MAAKNTASFEWEQCFILSVRPGYLIPLDINDHPDPNVWTRTEKPKRGVNDYYDVASGPTRLHRFSQSTNTWYSLEREPYIPQTFDVQPRKMKPIKAKTLEPIQINESIETLAGFSSIETFFQ
jgi:hypothetical protein